MVKVKYLLQVALGFALMAVVLYGVYRLLMALVAAFGAVESDVTVAVVAGAATVIVSVVSIVLSKRFENRAAIVQELRQKKVPVYEDIIQTFIGALMAGNLGKPQPTEAEMMEFFARSTEQLIIWGSDEVVLEYRKFRLNFAATAGDPLGLFLFEELLSILRKDLGHRNKGFARGTILGLFVNDIDDVLATMGHN